ncbi:MAG: RNA-binding protein [Chloroflexi bacterium]|nr:RNA-binding protein [Chloroflexota bacterium]
MESKLYVGNLSYNTTEDDLRQLFSQAGEIKQVTLILDRDTRRSKGFGFVEMTTQADAQKAIEMFNDHELDNRRITVSIARPREERGGGGGGRRRSY